MRQRTFVLLAVIAGGGTLAAFLWVGLQHRRQIAQEELAAARTHLDGMLPTPKHALSGAEKRALDAARSYAKSHWPELWQRAETVNEYAYPRPPDGKVLECLFTGERRGFPGYGQGEVWITVCGLDITESIYHSPEREPPKHPRVSREQAIVNSLRYLRRHHGEPGDYRLLDVEGWLMTSLFGQGRPVWHVCMDVVLPDGRWRYSLDVDVMNGRVLGEGHPESEWRESPTGQQEGPPSAGT